MTPQQLLSHLLKSHLESHGNLNAITQELGICKSQLMKYVEMTGSPRIDTAQRLFYYFGYELKVELKELEG